MAEGPTLRIRYIADLAEARQALSQLKDEAERGISLSFRGGAGQSGQTLSSERLTPGIARGGAPIISELGGRASGSSSAESVRISGDSGDLMSDISRARSEIRSLKAEAASVNLGGGFAATPQPGWSTQAWGGPTAAPPASGLMSPGALAGGGPTLHGGGSSPVYGAGGGIPISGIMGAGGPGGGGGGRGSGGKPGAGAGGKSKAWYNQHFIDIGVYFQTVFGGMEVAQSADAIALGRIRAGMALTSEDVIQAEFEGVHMATTGMFSSLVGAGINMTGSSNSPFAVQSLLLREKGRSEAQGRFRERDFGLGAAGRERGARFSGGMARATALAETEYQGTLRGLQREEEGLRTQMQNVETQFTDPGFWGQFWEGTKGEGSAAFRERMRRKHAGEILAATSGARSRIAQIEGPEVREAEQKRIDAIGDAAFTYRMADLDLAYRGDIAGLGRKQGDARMSGDRRRIGREVEKAKLRRDQAMEYWITEREEPTLLPGVVKAQLDEAAGLQSQFDQEDYDIQSGLISGGKDILSGATQGLYFGNLQAGVLRAQMTRDPRAILRATSNMQRQQALGAIGASSMPGFMKSAAEWTANTLADLGLAAGMQSINDREQLMTMSLTGSRDAAQARARGENLSSRSIQMRAGVEAAVEANRLGGGTADQRQLLLEAGIADQQAYLRELQLNRRHGHGQEVAAGTIARGVDSQKDRSENLEKAMDRVKTAIETLQAALLGVN